MAMNIISKDKKEIRWIGLPTNSAQVRKIEIPLFFPPKKCKFIYVSFRFIFIFDLFFCVLFEWFESYQQCSALEAEMDMRRERIESKQQQLRPLILQQISFKCLVVRNE